MIIGALGDVHGEFGTVDDIMGRHADVPLWVCVGDVASNDGEYFSPRVPLYFIKGNNEEFDAIAAAISGRPIAAELHYLVNGGPHRVGPWRVAALGGTFAPSWYNTPASALPHSRGHKSTTAYLKLGKRQEALDTIAHLDQLSSGDYRTQTGTGVLLAQYHLYDA